GLLRAGPPGTPRRQRRPSRRAGRHGRSPVDLQARPRRQPREPVDVRVLLVLPRRTEGDLSLDRASQSGPGALGRLRDRAVSLVVRRGRDHELAVPLLLSAVLLLRALPVLLERLLPALR